MVNSIKHIMRSSDTLQCICCFFMFCKMLSHIFTIVQVLNSNLTCCLKGCYLYCCKGSKEAHLIKSLSKFISVLLIIFIYCRVLHFPSPSPYLSLYYCSSLEKCINKYIYHLIIHPESQCLVPPWASA